MHRAFTLIEAIIVVSVMMILAGLISLSLVNSGKGQDLESAKVTVIQAIREAQANSMANLGDLPWGVHFEKQSAIIFTDSGSGYNPSDITNNRVKLMPSGVSLSVDFGGLQNLVFDKGKGTTAVPGTVTLSSSAPNTIQITINSQGMIDY